MDDYEREGLNRDSEIDSWIAILSERFKVPTSMALDLLTTKSYFLNNTHRRRPPTQYVRAIIQYGIGCNIVDIAN